MNETIPERDWKYLKKIKSEMLEALCDRINKEARHILEVSAKSEHEKYLSLYRHIKDSDQLVADCFNDWRRSNIFFKIPKHLGDGLHRTGTVADL